jgi:hypothetical protein
MALLAIGLRLSRDDGERRRFEATQPEVLTDRGEVT